MFSGWDSISDYHMNNSPHDMNECCNPRGSRPFYNGWKIASVIGCQVEEFVMFIVQSIYFRG